MKLVIATRNTCKTDEFRAILEGYDIEIASMDDFPDAPETVENGTTFVDNALKKARDVSRHTDNIALADDSGLVIDALGGAPGVLSARFATTTEERNHKVLDMMIDVPDSERTARFVCSLALVRPDGYEWTANSVCEGMIARIPKGTEGFGYDPLFFYPPYGRSFAEIQRNEKNSISHRGKALRLFLDAVNNEHILGE